MIEALIAANGARIAELKQQPFGGVNSLGDLVATEDGLWVVAELVMATAGTMLTVSLVHAGILPLAFLGLCGCVWLPGSRPGRRGNSCGRSSVVRER